MLSELHLHQLLNIKQPFLMVLLERTKDHISHLEMHVGFKSFPILDMTGKMRIFSDT